MAFLFVKMVCRTTSEFQDEAEIVARMLVQSDPPFKPLVSWHLCKAVISRDSLRQAHLVSFDVTLLLHETHSIGFPATSFLQHDLYLSFA